MTPSVFGVRILRGIPPQFPEPKRERSQGFKLFTPFETTLFLTVPLVLVIRLRESRKLKTGCRSEERSAEIKRAGEEAEVTGWISFEDQASQACRQRPP